jgi:phage terminase large subunit
MSTDEQAALQDPATFNPFDGCPWGVYLNRLSEAYMRRERGEFVELGDHHLRWAERFAAGDDFVLLAHRFGLKTFVVLAYICARLQYDDGYTALWLTNTEDLAKDKAHREFNKLTSRAGFLETLAEENRVEDTIKTKRFANGSAFHAGWLHGGLEGSRADLIVFDDIIKEKGDGDTQDIWEWCSGAAMPVGKRDSQEVFIGTRKRPSDLYEFLATETAYPIVEWPLIRDRWLANRQHTVGECAPEGYYTELPNPLPSGDGTVHVLWPAARDAAFIQDKYEKTGARMFNRAYCLVIGSREGLVYDWFNTEHVVAPVDPAAATWDETIYGVDWGHNNPSAILALIRQGETWTAVEEYYETRRTVNDHARALADMQERWGPGRVYCDPAEPANIEQFQRDGLNAVAAENDVTPGIQHVSAQRDRLRVAETCQNLRNEFSQYQYKNDDSDTPDKVNDHLMDSVRYALFSHANRAGGGFLISQ